MFPWFFTLFRDVNPLIMVVGVVAKPQMWYSGIFLGLVYFMLLAKDGSCVVPHPWFQMPLMRFLLKVCGRYSLLFSNLKSSHNFIDLWTRNCHFAVWVESSVDWFLQDLRPTISYLSPKEIELVHNALKVSFHLHGIDYVACTSYHICYFKLVVLCKLKLVLVLQLAFEAHDGQKRRSGEPFIIHPVEVARILGELVSFKHYKEVLSSFYWCIFHLL